MKASVYYNPISTAHIEEILEFEKVKISEVQQWLQANKVSPYIQGNNMTILRSMAFDVDAREKLSKDLKITKVRILQIYYASLKKACRIIKIEKANMVVSKNVDEYVLDFDVRDAMVDRNKGNVKHITELLCSSVFTILWNEKSAAAFKRNNINYFGELVNGFRKLNSTPKFGYKSLHNVEEELLKLGLKFVNKDIEQLKREK